MNYHNPETTAQRKEAVIEALRSLRERVEGMRIKFNPYHAILDLIDSELAKLEK